MMWPNNDVCQGLSEPSLGFRQALVHIIIWHCLAPAAQGLKTQYVQTISPHTVKLFASVLNVSIVWLLLLNLFLLS